MMAKPPQTPPSSDIDGVNEDRQPINAPANSKPDPGKALKHADDNSKARPKGGHA